MTTDYFSAHATREEAEAAAKLAAKRRTRKFVVVGAAAAVLLPTAAWAVITGITGTGDVNAAAGKAKEELVITEGTGSPALFPGTSGDITFKVANPNPYAVRLNTIASNGLTPTEGCQAAWYSSDLPASGSSYSFPKEMTDEELTIPAKKDGVNGTQTIVIKDAIKLSEDATTSCGYKISITITGDQKAKAVKVKA